MFCEKCGTELQNGAGFCPKCGNKVVYGEEIQQVRQHEDGPKKNKSRKKNSIGLFVIICLVVIVGILCVIIMGKGNSKSWKDDKYSIEITPQGKFDMLMTVYRCDNAGNWLEDSCEMEIPAVVSITEQVSDANDGYKKLVATFMYNYSKRLDIANELETQLGEKVWVNHSGWISVFDRYTGYSLDEDFTVLELNNKSYHITTDFEWIHENNTSTCVVTVTCPEDYDGAIFYGGPYSHDHKEEYNSLDLMSRLYTIEELSFLDEKYAYFSYTNK